MIRPMPIQYNRFAGNCQFSQSAGTEGDNFLGIYEKCFKNRRIFHLYSVISDKQTVSRCKKIEKFVEFA